MKNSLSSKSGVQAVMLATGLTLLQGCATLTKDKVDEVIGVNDTYAQVNNPRVQKGSEKVDEQQYAEFGADVKDSSKNIKFGPKGNGLELSTLDGLTGVEYSEQYGAIINIGAQINSDDGSTSFYIQGSIGEKEKRLLAGAGVKVGENGALMFMGEHFIQQRDFNSTEFDAKQNKIGVSFKIHGLEFGASYSKSEDVNLPDTELIVDSTTLWQKYAVHNTFVGAEASRFSFGKEFFVGANGALKAVLGASHIDGETMADGSLRYTQYLGTNGQWYVEAAKVGETKKYSAGYMGNADAIVKGATWNVGIENIDGQYGVDDNRFVAGLSIPLDATSSRTYNRPNYSAGIDIADSLSRYVQSEKSYLVLGQVKETGRTRLVEIDKTSLPDGTTVDAENGKITVGNLNAFTGFTSILKNGVSTTSGAFGIIDGKLVIKPALLEQPVAGVDDTYVLTTNGTPANIITIVVSKGSVIIESITSEVANSAPVGTPDSLVALKDTAKTFNKSDLLANDTDADGDTLSLDSFIQPTNGTLVDNEDGTITYTPNAGYTGSDSFTYIVKDEHGNVSSATLVTITVNAPVDSSTTVGAPTLDSKTETTVNSTVGTFTDADGVQNVTVELYSDAGLTNLVSTQANGDFTGLTASTTYYLVTKGEAYNATTEAWETKRSSALSVTTNAAPEATLSSAPTGLDLTTDSDTGSSTTDNITSDTTPTFTWNTLAGVTGYKISLDNGTSRINLGNVTTYTTGVLSSGDYQVKVRGYNDAGDGPASDALSVTIDAVAPTPTFTSFSVDQDGTYNGTLTATDATAVTFAVDSGASNGTLTINANGTFTYVPTPGYSGADSFVYSVTDLAENTTTQTVSVTVNAVPDLSGISSTFTAAGDFGPHSFDIAAGCVNCTGGTWSIVSRTTFGYSGTTVIADGYGGSMIMDSTTGVISGMFDKDGSGNINVNIRYTQGGVDYDKNINIYIPDQG